MFIATFKTTHDDFVLGVSTRRAAAERRCREAHRRWLAAREGTSFSQPQAVAAAIGDVLHDLYGVDASHYVETTVLELDQYGVPTAVTVVATCPDVE